MNIFFFLPLIPGGPGIFYVPLCGVAPLQGMKTAARELLPLWRRSCVGPTGSSVGAPRQVLLAAGLLGDPGPRVDCGVSCLNVRRRSSGESGLPSGHTRARVCFVHQRPRTPTGKELFLLTGPQQEGLGLRGSHPIAALTSYIDSQYSTSLLP